MSRRVCIVVAMAVCVAARSMASCPLTSRWPNGQVAMQYNLPTTGALINGTTSWVQNAQSAMQEWSAVSSGFRFIDGGVSGGGDDNRDNVNNMFFSDTAGGDAFEGDVLALTLTRTRADGTALESDIVFNRSASWNAYDGPIRISANGAPVFDFRRVVLHELGHVLGLGHPDESCDQSVAAVMNARTTETDRLTEDDRNGLSFLYSGGNQPPVADAGPDQQGDGTLPFVLNGGGSRDADGAVVSYDWEIAGELVARRRVAEITLRRGTHEVRLIVADDDGATASDTMTILVGLEFTPPQGDNERPVADAGGDQTAQSGRPISLDGSGSFDPDGVIDRFVWTMGNVVLGRDPEIRLSLPVGQHLITLAIFDDVGDSATDSIVVTVEVASTSPSEPPDAPIMDAPPVIEPPGAMLPCGGLGVIAVLGMLMFFLVARLRVVGRG